MFFLSAFLKAAVWMEKGEGDKFRRREWGWVQLYQ